MASSHHQRPRDKTVEYRGTAGVALIVQRLCDLTVTGRTEAIDVIVSAGWLYMQRCCWH